MSYGPRYDIPHAINDQPVTISMRPYEESDAKILAEGISQPRVQEFLLLHGGIDAKSEAEHFDQVRKDQHAVDWILALSDGNSERPIGVTSLRLKSNGRAKTGFVIIEPALWGKGIAKLTHAYRTWFAFMELGLLALSSDYVSTNIGSGRALEGVGYVPWGREPLVHLSGGKWHDIVYVACYNPQTAAVFWPNGGIPEDVQAGMKLTRIALDRVTATLSPR